MNDFWNKQSTINGVGAVNFDANMHTLENKAIEPHIKDCKYVLDLGCGNGATTKYLAACYPNTEFLSIDSSIEMIKQAKKSNTAKNITFLHDDAVHFKAVEAFDAVIGKRLLINIKENKLKVLDNIEASLKEGGKYIMVENFIEPLTKINELRLLLGYDIIKIHDFNEYLDHDFIKAVERNDLCLTQTVDFGSLYYFASRVFNPNGSYESQINIDVVKLSLMGHFDMIQGYSPEKMLIFEKISDIPLVGGMGIGYATQI